ncbi:methionyl-tRNA formyltransferase [Pelagibacteraceae bacterium]|nr:methionyl-tRNA formyltransferase [Pelagibacteraceae bacterium]
MQNYNVLFMGTSKFAVPILEGLLESSVNIQAVFSAPPKLANRGMKQTLSPVAKFAEEYQLPLEYPTSLKDPEIINKINELNPDIIFVIAYGYILPKEIIDIPKLGCFNLHGSLLPKYRGAAPIQRSIIAGDKVTGVSFIKVDEGLDTGDVLLDAELIINDEDSYQDLEKNLSQLGKTLLNNFFDKLNTGGEAIKQDDNLATYANKIDKTEARINWQDNAQLINQKIRAFNPNPGAWFEMDGKRIKVMSSKVFDIDGNPGVILNDEFVIGCGKQALQPLTLKKEGKGLVTLTEFLKGNKVNVGTKL